MKNLLFISFLFLFVFSCQKEDDEGAQTDPVPSGPIELSNQGAETGRGGLPDDWWFRDGPYEVVWTDSVAFSGSRSIGITGHTASPDDFGYWAQTVTENIQEGKQLRLRVNIKTIDVTGEGASIVIRGDDTIAPQGQAELFATTQGDLYIGGTFEWKEYSVLLEEPISPAIRSITVYLILLPNTTGSVFFDDVRLSYE